jgi:transcriptional regulator with XRE-family HTH domain
MHPMQALTDYLALTGMSQTQLAALCELTDAELSKYLARKMTPSLKTAKRIAVRTGIRLDKLAEDIEVPPRQAPATPNVS